MSPIQSPTSPIIFIKTHLLHRPTITPLADAMATTMTHDMPSIHQGDGLEPHHTHPF